MYICILMMIEHAEQMPPWPCDLTSRNNAAYDLVWKQPATAGEHSTLDSETMMYKWTTLCCEQIPNKRSWLDTWSTLDFLTIPGIFVKKSTVNPEERNICWQSDFNHSKLVKLQQEWRIFHICILPFGVLLTRMTASLCNKPWQNLLWFAKCSSPKCAPRYLIEIKLYESITEQDLVCLMLFPTL